jgi:Xaa-Pro dipeptidase
MSYPEYYAEHIQTMQDRAKEALSREGIEGLVIHSGQSKNRFLDDNPYPFAVNPHFKAWLPITDNPNCWLLINGIDKPKLIFYRPDDFWHTVPPIPDGFWVEHFEIIYLSEANQVDKHLPYDKADYAYVGEYIEVAKALGFDIINPDRAIQYLHYQRAYKTDYELACMREANKAAINGHKAAYQAFLADKSEFEINLAYHQATRQGDNDLPYSNIIALNHHAATLHYTTLERQAPNTSLSFLIDAGASFHGYAADITRTYVRSNASEATNEFAELITGVDKITLAAVDKLKPGIGYLDVHLATHEMIADLLCQTGIVSGDTASALEQGITHTFFPHGIGHFLGLQVHDVGGQIADDRGTPNPPPAAHPYLRVTRSVEARQVFTIEPGLYFIDSLLAKLKASENAQSINWDKVERLRPFGGIRIEDNVIVHKDHNENMTRSLGLD